MNECQSIKKKKFNFTFLPFFLVLNLKLGKVKKWLKVECQSRIKTVNCNQWHCNRMNLWCSTEQFLGPFVTTGKKKMWHKENCNSTKREPGFLPNIRITFDCTNTEKFSNYVTFSCICTWFFDKINIMCVD